jgi:MtrB/PioB family decaheme-associated outer membrane protein
MTKHSTFRAIALAGVCLLPLAAAAADDEDRTNNELSVGGGYQSSTSPFFGRYTGVVKKGFEGDLDFTLKQGDAWDSGGATYSSVTGIGLLYGRDHTIGPESSIEARYGQQGSWGVYAGYDAITYVGNTIQSPYYPSGLISPGLRAYGGAPSMTSATGAYTTITTAGSATSYSAANYANGLLTLDTGTRRDIFKGGAKFYWDNWLITSDISHEHKEGTLDQSTYFGVNPAFALPINYDTDRFDVKAAYASKKLQASIGYTLSSFTDNHSIFAAPDVIAGTASSYATAFGPPGVPTTAIQQANMAFSQMPSSEAHYFTAQAAYALTPTTRLSGNFRLGLEMQNDTLPAAGYGASLTVNPTYSLLATNPNSLNGLARVYQGSVQLTSRPLSNVDVKVAYSLDERDVDTSQYAIAGMTHGLELGNFMPGSAFSVPQGWTKQKFSAEAGYSFMPETKLTVGYTLNDVDRSVAQVGRNVESTGWAKLSEAVPSIHSNGYVMFSYSDRSASAIHTYLPWQFFDGTPSAGYPSITFYEAARTQEAVKMRANYTPGAEYQFSLNGKLTNNAYTYPAGIIGNARDYNATIGPELNYEPSSKLSFNLFYNYEEIYYGNRGAGAPYWINGGYGWSASSTDSTQTVGINGTIKATDKLKLALGYTYATGDVRYNLFDGVTSTSCAACAVSSAAYANVVAPPTINTTMHNLTASGEYELTPSLALWAGYQYNMFKDADWAYTAWQAVTQTSATGYTTGSGAVAPKDHENVISARVKFKF